MIPRIQRKAAVLFFLFSFLLTLTPPVAAAWAPEGTRTRKFQRGLHNTFFSPVEFTHALQQVQRKDALIPSWLTGGFRGLVKMGIRAVTGVYEIATVPFPWPADYRPLSQPEFATDYLPVLSDDPSGDAKR